jgi:hypothetical protein
MALLLPTKTKARRLKLLDLQIHPQARTAFDLWSSAPLESRMPALCDPEELDDLLPYLPIPALPRGNSNRQFDVIGQFGVLALIQEYRPEVVYLQVPAKKEARDVVRFSQAYLLMQQSGQPEPLHALAVVWKQSTQQRWPVRSGLFSQNKLARELGVHVDQLRRVAETLFKADTSDERALLKSLLPPPKEKSNPPQTQEKPNGKTQED